MIELRPANCKEIARLWDLRMRAVDHACTAHDSAPVLAAWLAAPAPVSLRRLVAQGGGIAEEAGALLDAASGEVDAVFVEPARHGRGLGALLMAAIDAMARAAGHTRMFLSASLNAVPFYRRAGFAAVREAVYPHRSGIGIGIGIAPVYMEKRLVDDDRCVP